MSINVIQTFDVTQIAAAHPVSCQNGSTMQSSKFLTVW